MPYRLYFRRSGSRLSRSDRPHRADNAAYWLPRMPAARSPGLVKRGAVGQSGEGRIRFEQRGRKDLVLPELRHLEISERLRNYRGVSPVGSAEPGRAHRAVKLQVAQDRKSTRLNSSHTVISYA